MARPSKIHAQHTRSRPGLRIYTLSHLEFFISRKRKKENTRTLYGFSFGHSQSLYTAVIFFFSFWRMYVWTLLYLPRWKRRPLPLGFSGFSGIFVISLARFEFCFFLFCLWDTHNENALCRLLDSPIELGRGGPQINHSAVCVYINW
jgi:hypothetical protein